MELGTIGLTSLPDLLASLLPAGTPLHSLTLRRGSTSAAALGQQCTALSALTMLALDGVVSATSLEAGMAALVSQTPLLADLGLSMRRYTRNGRLVTLPSAVVQRQGLRRLSLEGPAICPGPYLSGERQKERPFSAPVCPPYAGMPVPAPAQESFLLSHAVLFAGIQELSLLLREEEGLPACLAEARSLEQLSLSWRRPHGQLDVAQVASTLAPSHCPRLVTLRLSNCYKPSQQERAVLKERVPQLLEIVGGVEWPPAPTLQDWLRAGLSKLAWAWQNAY